MTAATSEWTGLIDATTFTSALARVTLVVSMVVASNAVPTGRIKNLQSKAVYDQVLFVIL